MHPAAVDQVAHTFGKMKGRGLYAPTVAATFPSDHNFWSDNRFQVLVSSQCCSQVHPNKKIKDIQRTMKKLQIEASEIAQLA